MLLVDDGYLDLIGTEVVSGQPLGPGDFAPESRAVVVNRAFVDRILGGRNPVGGRLRFPERTGESSVVSVPTTGSTLDIVGVVSDPGVDAYGPGVHPAIYAPLDLAAVTPRAVGLMGMPDARSSFRCCSWGLARRHPSCRYGGPWPSTLQRP